MNRAIPARVSSRVRLPKGQAFVNVRTRSAASAPAATKSQPPEDSLRRTAARIPSPKAASRAPNPRARPGAMGPEAASSGHQIRSMGEGANRKEAPKKNRPPPTRALAICLNTLTNIHNQPPARNIRLRVAHRAAKGGARARRLSQSAKTWRLLTKRTKENHGA